MKIDLITLGCSKNLVDSERLLRQLEATGYQVEHDSNNPTGEIAIINTCGFIGDAKEESINTILQFAQRKTQGKLKQLYVMGCLSERYLKELVTEISEVDKFYGKFNYMELLSDLGKQYRQDLSVERKLTTPHHYAYLKISEGCNRFCSYCAIPLITGRHTSRPINELLDEVRWMTRQGVREFQVIAQDLSSYGLDLYKKQSLPEFIERMADISGVDWIRLHYAYPAQFPYDILRVMRERDNVCNYLDLALQHVSDNMLRLMRRHITKSETIELLQRIRSEVPNICIRTTMLVGHPGETIDDFEELKQFIKETKFERLGTFAYSDEEGTYSNLHYKDNISQSEKLRRVDEIMSIQEDISLTNNTKLIGNRLKTIIDREESDFYIGRTQYDSPEVDQEVLIDKQRPLQVGDFYDIKIVNVEPFDIYGKL